MSKPIDLGAITAYGIAKDHGFQGTEEEWLDSLKGENGDSATDAQVTEAVNSYIEANPDTIVPDGSITEAKLAQDVKDKFDALSEEIANIGGGGGGTAATLEITGIEMLPTDSAPEVIENEGSTAQARSYTLKMPKGEPGATPQRGVDYWTAEDQQIILNDVLAALPAWEGGNY